MTEMELSEIDLNGEERNAGGQKKKVALESKMTLLNGVTVIVGSIIGSGIFISPTGVLENTGSVNMALVVWLASGVFSMVGAYCYTELGCMIRKSGADYAYIMVTFGRFLAFMRLWVDFIIVKPGSMAVVSTTFGIYMLKPFYLDCEPPAVGVRLMAVCCISVLAVVNCYSVSWANKVQDIFAAAKLLALALIIGTGIYMLSNGHTENFTWENTESDYTKIALSFYSGLYAYDGWNFLNIIIEELRYPERDLPRAICISMILVTVVYMLTNIAYFTTLSAADMLSSNAVALTFGNYHYGILAWVIPLGVAMSTFGGLNGMMLTSSRLFYAGAREGQMPEVLTMIQRTRLTPAPSVLFQSMISVLFLFFPKVGSLIDSVGFATWISIGAGALCIPVLRYTHPEFVRPIRVNLFWPIIYVLATILVTVLPIFADPKATGIGIGIILSGLPVYAVCLAWTNKPACMRKASSAITHQVQKLLMVVPEEKSEQD